MSSASRRDIPKSSTDAPAPPSLTSLEPVLFTSAFELRFDVDDVTESERSMCACEAIDVIVDASPPPAAFKSDLREDDVMVCVDDESKMLDFVASTCIKITVF